LRASPGGYTLGTAKHKPAMPSYLPDYSPPNEQRAAVAAGLSPILVLLTFTAIVVRWMDVETGFAVFVACGIWVFYELHVYQASIDRYNQDYVRRHLDWRSSEALLALSLAPDVPEATRSFVERFVRAERVLLRDGQMP
jgi:hypothetical protein